LREYLSGKTTGFYLRAPLGAAKAAATAASAAGSGFL
jgi:hypothetical protein